MNRQVLTIAGSDSGGGAGIQADIKTFQELGVYSTSIVTAVTAQNTQGVHGILPISTEMICQQIDAIGEDFELSALKTGMLFNAEIIKETASGIRKFGWDNLVVDPVMIAKGGAALLQHEAVEAMQKYLLPLAKVVTPNIPEAEVLSGMVIHDAVSRQEAAAHILAFGAGGVVIKGGHGTSPDFSEDFYLDRNGESLLLRSTRLKTIQTHGTGCTFSAALAAELAKGETVETALHTAKRFIQAALAHPLNIGSGHGPTNHSAFRNAEEKEEVYVVQ